MPTATGLCFFRMPGLSGFYSRSGHSSLLNSPNRVTNRAFTAIYLSCKLYNMKKNLLLLISTMAVLLIITSCKKGETGPQGPTGNANVMYSPWFTPATYQKDTVFGIWGFNYNQAAASITQSILDSGTVLTFGKLLGYNSLVWPAGQVAPLPLTISYNQGGVTNDTWSALSRPGNLRIRFVNDRNIYTSIATAHQFRYIIIPGGTPTGRVTQLSYEELCRKYNIPE